MEIPLTVNLDIHSFLGSTITDYESGLTNCVLHLHNGKTVVTQRPSIDITEDASGLGLNNRARGIYYWEYNDTLYIVHDNDIYADTQDSTPLAGATVAAGTSRVSFGEAVGSPALAILDSENNDLFLVTDGTPDTIAQITTNIPATIVPGCPVLDGYLFIMDESGEIHNSNLDDFATWGALDFITAERDNDKGVYLGKHHDNIVAFSTRSIEFLYDASNATGSPLNRRQDISYQIGCADGLGVWESSDVIYFVGSTDTGPLAIYKLENFQISMISTDSLNSFITQGRTQEGFRINLCGIGSQGGDVLIVNIYNLNGSGNISPALTLSYNQGLWGFWSTTINSNTLFPLMAWTKRTGGENSSNAARTGQGIFHNGDIVALNDKMIPVDTRLAFDGVFEPGVFEADVFVASASDIGNNIESELRLGLQDAGHYGWKFQNFEFVRMESTESSQTLTIKHSDESSNNFGTGNTIDTSDTRKEIYQGGRFLKRNIQLEYAGNEQIFLEAYGADIEGGE
jgi:hypothetical protein